jgi:hypothetical protein
MEFNDFTYYHNCRWRKLLGFNPCNNTFESPYDALLTGGGSVSDYSNRSAGW